MERPCCLQSLCDPLDCSEAAVPLIADAVEAPRRLTELPAEHPMTEFPADAYGLDQPGLLQHSCSPDFFDGCFDGNGAPDSGRPLLP